MAKTYNLLNFRFSILAAALLCFSLSTFALVLPSAEPAAKPANELSKMTAEDFLALTPKKYKELTGEKLTLSQKISLKMAQRKMKQAMRNHQPVDDSIKATAFDTDDFNIGGFVLGLLLSVIGVLIAYLIGDTVVIKWAWIGFAIFLIIFLLAVLL